MAKLLLVKTKGLGLHMAIMVFRGDCTKTTPRNTVDLRNCSIHIHGSGVHLVIGNYMAVCCVNVTRGSQTQRIVG